MLVERLSEMEKINWLFEYANLQEFDKNFNKNDNFVGWRKILRYEIFIIFYKRWKEN